MKTSTWFSVGMLTAVALFAPQHARSADLEAVHKGVAEIVDDAARRCRYDLETYCANVTPGEGRLAFCLMANADKRSPQCEYALFDARRAAGKIIETVKPASDACSSDIAALCSGVEPGDGKIAKCLVDQTPSLSKECDEVISIVGKVIFPAQNQSFAEYTQAPTLQDDGPVDAPAEPAQQAAEPVSKAAVLTALEASVQEIIEKGKEGCSSDLQAHCSNVTPGEGRLAFCLIANADKRSATCEAALAEARQKAEVLVENVNRSVESCLPDIAALCSETKPGEGRIVQCLTDQKPMLTEACSQVVDRVEKVVFPARNQPFADSAAPALTGSPISTGALQIDPALAAAVAPAPKCRTIEASLTDWGKEATSSETRKRLTSKVANYIAKQGNKDSKSGRSTVSCSTNVDLGFTGNYTCRGRATVCVSAVEENAAPSGSSIKPAE